MKTVSKLFKAGQKVRVISIAHGDAYYPSFKAIKNITFIIENEMYESKWRDGYLEGVLRGQSYSDLTQIITYYFIAIKLAPASRQDKLIDE